MMKKIGIIKRVLCISLVFLLNINAMAAIVADNDGSAFITKAEFDALKNNFQAQIDSYNNSIDSKIDGAIAAYLSGIKLSTMEELPLITDSLKNLRFCSYLPFKVKHLNLFSNDEQFTWKSASSCGSRTPSDNAYEYNWFGVNEKTSKIAMSGAQGPNGNYLTSQGPIVRGITPLGSTTDTSNYGGISGYEQWGFGGGVRSCYDRPGTSGYKNCTFILYMKLTMAQYVGNGQYNTGLPMGIPSNRAGTWTDEDKGYTPIVNFDNATNRCLSLVGANWNWFWNFTQPDYFSSLALVKDPMQPVSSKNLIQLRSFFDDAEDPEETTFVSQMCGSYVLGLKYGNNKYMMIPSDPLFIGPSNAVFIDCEPGNNVVESHKGAAPDWDTTKSYPKIITTKGIALVDLSQYQLAYDSRDYYINTYGWISDPTNGSAAVNVTSGNIDLGPVEGMRPAFTTNPPAQGDYWFAQKTNEKVPERVHKGFDPDKLTLQFEECWSVPSPVAYGSVKELYNGTLMNNAGLSIKQGNAVPFFKSKPGSKTEVEIKCTGSVTGALSGARIYITTDTVLQQSNAATGTVGGVSKELWDLPLNADGSFKVTFDSDTVEKTYYISLSPKESYTEKFRSAAPKYIKISDVTIKSIKDN